MPMPPQFCPTPADLDLLELVRNGAYRPTDDRPAVMHIPALDDAPATIELVDPEGVPLARVSAEPDGGGGLRIALRAAPQWLGQLSARPFEALYHPPAATAGAVERGASVILVDRSITDGDLDGLPPGRPVVLLALAGPSTAPAARTIELLHAAQRRATGRSDLRPVAVPMTARWSMTKPDLYASVLQSYAPHGYHRLDPPSSAIAPARGMVLFFTGLSGSGKSTIARAVRNTILERHGVPVTLLDGDVVRRNLSAGLGFSPADRETNVRRIGWVAAKIGHHGGIAICSPIAPYDSTRRHVREIVTEHGAEFVLVHISTPLEACEQRDRKGLYAKARAGQIPDFTGVSAPYENPDDADLVLDTTTMTVDEAQRRVLALLDARGRLKFPASS